MIMIMIMIITIIIIIKTDQIFTIFLRVETQIKVMISELQHTANNSLFKVCSEETS